MWCVINRFRCLYRFLNIFCGLLNWFCWRLLFFRLLDWIFSLLLLFKWSLCFFRCICNWSVLWNLLLLNLRFFFLCFFHCWIVSLSRLLRLILDFFFIFLLFNWWFLLCSWYIFYFTRTILLWGSLLYDLWFLFSFNLCIILNLFDEFLFRLSLFIRFVISILIISIVVVLIVCSLVVSMERILRESSSWR